MCFSVLFFRGYCRQKRFYPDLTSFLTTKKAGHRCRLRPSCLNCHDYQDSLKMAFVKIKSDAFFWFTDFFPNLFAYLLLQGSWKSTVNHGLSRSRFSASMLGGSHRLFLPINTIKEIFYETSYSRNTHQ